VQADILKEDQAQNTCIFSTEFALRMMGDVQQFFSDNEVRNFYSVSISGYHIAEAGANPISQLAFTLSNGFTIVEYYLARGMKIDDFAPNLSFFFSNGMDPEYAVIGRVARRIRPRHLRGDHDLICIEHGEPLAHRAHQWSAPDPDDHFRSMCCREDLVSDEGLGRIGNEVGVDRTAEPRRRLDNDWVADRTREGAEGGTESGMHALEMADVDEPARVPVEPPGRRGDRIIGSDELRRAPLNADTLRRRFAPRFGRRCKRLAEPNVDMHWPAGRSGRERRSLRGDVSGGGECFRIPSRDV
jgi:hypothetical protein